MPTGQATGGGGRYTPKRVADISRNGWQIYSEMSGRYTPKDAINAGKKLVVIHDYLDKASGLTVSMYRKLLAAYKKMGYKQEGS